MSNILVALFAYIIDKIFGEFKFIKHPIIYIGELISFFEKKFYKNSVFRGLLLVMFVLSIVSFFSISIYLYLELLSPYINIIVSSIIASIFIAHKMLYDSVKNILECENKKEAISMLVSRDTKDMSESDIYKAAIETYAENLSDGVIAPLFYLLLFNLPGIIIYKAINTMDSMVGYKNKKYEKFGKVAAILDDIVNYVPARITAILIMILAKQKNIFAFYEDGKKHESPNAGHPITAMALSIGVKLGGDTSYFGKIKHKPYFGNGKIKIKYESLQKAFSFKERVDKFILVMLTSYIILLKIYN
jgi:adenosylcobinamide-phosphate synthase